MKVTRVTSRTCKVEGCPELNHDLPRIGETQITHKRVYSTLLEMRTKNDQQVSLVALTKVNVNIDI